jgi:hypothetical protein
VTLQQQQPQLPQLPTAVATGDANCSSGAAGATTQDRLMLHLPAPLLQVCVRSMSVITLTYAACSELLHLVTLYKQDSDKLAMKTDSPHRPQQLVLLPGSTDFSLH